MIRTAKLRELQAELPGHSLVLTYVAGLPVCDLELEVRILARERISAIQEYVLRCIATGVNDSGKIDLVLGIGDALVRPTLAFLQSYDLVEEVVDDAAQREVAFGLTEKGRAALLDLALRRAVVLSIPCTSDGLTGELRPRRARMRLATRDAAAAQALHAMPAKFDRPSLMSIEKRDVQRVMRDIRRASPSKLPDGEVLDILEVSRALDKYRIVDVAVFDDGKRGFVFRVLDRGVRLKEYEELLGYLAETQPEVLPVELAAAEALPSALDRWLSPEEREEAQRNADSLAELEERVQQAEEAAQDDSAEAGVVDRVNTTTREQLELVMRERDELRQMIEQGFQMIGTEEHRRQLERAFKNAKELVIIESPWLTRDAIDEEFKRWMFEAIDRGLDVILAWGYPDDGKPESRRKNERSRSMAEMLQEQAKRPRRQGKRPRGDRREGTRGRLRVVELGDTHAKQLVADTNFAVISSFNWTSFRGEKRAGDLVLRNEIGYRIGVPEKVKEIRDSLLQRVSAAEARAQ